MLANTYTAASGPELSLQLHEQHYQPFSIPTETALSLLVIAVCQT
jgi:hypothetical protein